MGRLRNQGLTFEEIGRRLGVSRQCVYMTLLKVGKRDVRPLACRECGAVLVESPPGNRPPLPALCLACLARHPEAPFCARLRTFRHAAGLTQGQLADRCGLPRGTVQRYEAGRVVPRWPDVLALARGLGAGLLTLGLGLTEGTGDGTGRQESSQNEFLVSPRARGGAGDAGRGRDKEAC
jgi:transcriptional regulator with XRE-family HTH domain